MKICSESNFYENILVNIFQKKLLTEQTWILRKKIRAVLKYTDSAYCYQQDYTPFRNYVNSEPILRTRRLKS